MGSNEQAGSDPPGLGLEDGVVVFKRKPAKMGEDYIIWIPRLYVRNRLVDTTCEYDIFLRKAPAKKRPGGTSDAGKG